MRPGPAHNPYLGPNNQKAERQASCASGSKALLFPPQVLRMHVMSLSHRLPMRLLSGSLALQALTTPHHHDPWYPLDTADSLRTWLTDQAARWEADDPSFAAHRAIGFAELDAGATYRSLVQRRDEAAASYQAAPGRLAVEDTMRMLAGGEKAVAGLRAFVEGRSDADDDAMRAKRARAALKLEACGESEADRSEAVATAVAGCAEWRELQAAEARLEAAREALGLPALEQAARSLERQKGKQASRGGQQFETAAGEPLLDKLLASLAGGGGDGKLVVLQGVTLGMAKAEIDYLFCAPRKNEPFVDGAAGTREADVVNEPGSRRKQRSGQRLPKGVVVDAVAMCEVKLDASDLGKAVSKSAEVMAWLGGERSRYDPEEWTNRHYPCGHFALAEDGETERVHACTSRGVTYLFDRQSFASFRERDGRHEQPAALPPRLHVVTSTRRRAGYATVRPVCSKTFGRMQHKASRDLELLDALRSHEAAERYDWETLRVWLREGTSPLSPIGALRLFAADAAAAERLHVKVYGEEAGEAE